MRRTKLGFAFLLIVLFQTGCGSDDPKVIQLPTASGLYPAIYGAPYLSYRLRKVSNVTDSTSGACDTGFHEFRGDTQDNVLRQYCAALVNEDLNHHCAAAERYAKVESECGSVRETSNGSGQ